MVCDHDWSINQLIDRFIDWLIEWLTVCKNSDGTFISDSALDWLLVWYQHLIDWSISNHDLINVIMIWSLWSWFGWLINTFYSRKWHILHGFFLHFLYVSCCSVTNISRTILHVVWRTTLTSEKKMNCDWVILTLDLLLLAIAEDGTPYCTWSQ